MVERAPTLVAPTVNGTCYRWCFGGERGGQAEQMAFTVDRRLGARITEASIGGDNLLIGPEVNAANFGATCWTSPQSDWGWPPVPEHDALPYAAAVPSSGTGADVDVVELRGQPAAASGIALTKRFHVSGGERRTLSVDYGFENRQSERRTLAPWEISRHAVGGLTFFPKGAGIDVARSTLKAIDSGDTIWFAYDAAAITDHQKLFAHGSEGWVAHIDIARRRLLIKTFPVIAVGDQAPGESQIEIYADPTHSYIEVEQQGAYRAIEPGGSLRWEVVWRVRSLPPTVAPTVGNRDLLSLVRDFIAMPGTGVSRASNPEGQHLR